LKSVVCREFGPPENLVIEESPDPTPGAGEIVIDVKAATVTFPDALMIEDKYQFKPAPPFTPGGEAAGVVLAVGEGVDGFSIGDRVIGNSGLVGAFTDRLCVAAATSKKLPDSVGFGEATGILYSYGTVYYGLVDRANLLEGETLLVLGAGGNLGLAAIEVGKLLGARVIAAASSEDKLALCRERGADETINYSDEKLKDRAKELTDGKGVDVVFDTVGGDYAESALRAIAWCGRFLVIGFTAGIPTIPLNLALLKSCQIIGVFLGGMVGREPATRDRIAAELDKLLESGKLNPHVSREYSLDEAGQALRDLLDRRVLGKVIIAP